MRPERCGEFTCQASLLRVLELLVEMPENAGKVEARRGKDVLVSDEVEHRQVRSLEDGGDDGRDEGCRRHGDYLHVRGVQRLHVVRGLLDDEVAEDVTTLIRH